RLAIRAAPPSLQASSAASASGRLAPPPTMPSPQLSQRLTGPPMPGRESIQPKSGSPQAGQGGLSGPAPASRGTTAARCRPLGVTRSALMAGSVRPVRLSEIMTAGVIITTPEASAISVARQMRDHRVGSVVIVDSGGAPVAMVTDRDLALRV